MSLVLALALSVAAAAPPEESRPLSWNDSRHRNRHPGQNGPLTEEQAAMARAAWQYFENNFQPETCLYNSVDKYPSTTMWDTASAIAGLVGAFELGLIEPPTFDERMGCLLDALNRMELFRGQLPNKAYHTQTLEQVDYNNNPGELGFSAIDLGRLLTWLAIVKNRYPTHAEAVDRAVLRWTFCDVIDRGGTLYGGMVDESGGVSYPQEGRLGYEEYAAIGFQLWGFDTTAASRTEPYHETRIHGIRIPYDHRDPKQYGAHTYVTTEPFILGGIEMNWDLATDRTAGDDWQSDRIAKKLAKRVYKAQVRRYRRTRVPTARTEHHVDGPPYFVYDSVFSDGIAWPTLAEDGKTYPELATVSSKAVVAMDVLFDSRYTRGLFRSILPLVDPHRGVFEGYTESGRRALNTLTANTNGIILASLLYKVQGKLYRPNGYETLWDRVPTWEYTGDNQCLPRSADDWVPGVASDQRGRYEDPPPNP